MADLGLLFDPALHQALSNLDVALEWSRAGVPVFPCYASGEKVKCPLRGVFWHSAATTNERQIRTWWEQNPDALPALHLGRADLLVIDADGAEGVQDWFAVLDGRDDDAPTVETPSGGEHRYFRRGGRDLGNGRGSLPAKRGKIGIDVRGKGGYVIAPGATLLDGRRYEANGYDILSAPEIPDWLVEILQSQREADEQRATPRMEPGAPVSDDRRRAYGERALEAEMRELAMAPQGTRNETANLCAFRIGQLVGGGCLTEQEAYAALHNAAASWGIAANDKALGARGTIARALRDGARSPRYCPDEVPDTRGAEAANALLARKVVEAPDGTLADAETGEIIQPERIETAGSQDYPDDALRVPGLIGEMADWIMATSMYPCRLFATAAALTAVGGAVGRQVYTGVPRSSTSLYWLTIAPTGGGKDWPQEAVKAMYRAAGLGTLLKSAVSSSAKLGMTLGEQPAQVQIIDEVGKVLRKFVARNSSSQEMSLLDDYCSVWGKNMGSFEPEGVTTRTDTVIHRPCLTLYGATTPTNFFSQLRSAQVAGGFLNRFLVLQRHERVEPVEQPMPADEVPPLFVEALQTLRTWQDHKQLQAYSTMADDAERPPPAFIVPASPEAERLMKDALARARIMIVQSDSDPVLEVYARAAEMVKRMAAILACARHWRDMDRCRIEADDVTFASNLVEWSMASFVEGLRNHMSENEHQANVKMVLAMVRSARGGRIGRSELYRKVDGRLQVRELTGILAGLIEAGKIELLEEKPPEGSKGGRPKTSYMILR